jgi:hypothetical protein
MDAPDPLRNHDSAGHPLTSFSTNRRRMVCNTVRTLLAYLDSRLDAARSAAS